MNARYVMASLGFVPLVYLCVVAECVSLVLNAALVVVASRVRLRHGRSNRRRAFIGSIYSIIVATSALCLLLSMLTCALAGLATGRVAGGSGGCTASAFLFVVFGAAYLQTLSGMAATHYLLVCRNFRVSDARLVAGHVIATLLDGVAAFILCVAPSQAYVAPSHTYCLPPTATPSGLALWFAYLFGLSCVVIVASYSLMWCHVRAHLQAATRVAAETTDSALQCTPRLAGGMDPSDSPLSTIPAPQPVAAAEQLRTVAAAAVAVAVAAAAAPQGSALAHSLNHQSIG